MGTGSVDPELPRLEWAGFVTRRPSSLPGQIEYRFRHVLTREVVYRSIPTALRAQAHKAVGQWLEQVVGGRTEEFAELLAHHFGAATATDLAWPEPADREWVRDRAFGYLILAGEAARQRFSTRRAVECHVHARALATTDAEHLRAFEALAVDHDVAFHGDAAEGWYREALAIARRDPGRAGDRSRLCRRLAWLMAGTPGAFRASPDPAMVEALITEGLAAAPDEASRAWLLVVRGMSARLFRGSEPFGQGRRPDQRPISDRIASVKEAVRIGHAKDLPDLLRAANDTLTVLYGTAGRYREAILSVRMDWARFRARGRVWIRLTCFAVAPST
jgi:hypothetical protein